MKIEPGATYRSKLSRINSRRHVLEVNGDRVTYQVWFWYSRFNKWVGGAKFTASVSSFLEWAGEKVE